MFKDTSIIMDAGVPRLDLAVAGFDNESLREAINNMALEYDAPITVFVTNGSRQIKHSWCPTAYRLTYKPSAEIPASGNTGLALRTRFEPVRLTVGTAAHAMLEDYANGKEPLARAFEQLSDAMADPSASPEIIEELTDAMIWLQDIFPVVERSWTASMTGDRVVGTEVTLWVAVPVEFQDRLVVVVFVGRLDAIIEDMGTLRHMQFKTRSRRSDEDAFVAALEAGPHEVGYGLGLHLLHKQGVFALPYGGSRIGVLYKTNRPSEEPADPPKGLLDLIEAGKVRFSVAADAIERLTDCTDKQWEKAESLWTNHIAREVKREAKLQNWAQSVLATYDVDLDEETMLAHARRLFAQIARNMAEDAALRPDDLRLERRRTACTAYNEACPFLRHCAFYDDLLDEGRWCERERDYVDDLTTHLAENLDKNKVVVR